MKVDVFNKQKNLQVSVPAVKKIVEAVITLEKQWCDEVSISFVTTKKICELHQEYFNDPNTTDCISFPMDDESSEYRVLGEVFICPQTAIDYTHLHGGNAYEECTLYIIHGLLHLMGYDDLEPRLKAIMRRAEKKHMTNLKKLNLHLEKNKSIG